VNYEQINMFGERDPAEIVAEWLKERHTREIKSGFLRKEHITYPFEKFVLYEFSHYSGGTASYSLANYYRWFDFSPAGVKLTAEKRGGREIFVKKTKILKILNIRDDKKDVMRGEEE